MTMEQQARIYLAGARAADDADTVSMEALLGLVLAAMSDAAAAIGRETRPLDTAPMPDLDTAPMEMGVTPARQETGLLTTDAFTAWAGRRQNRRRFGAMDATDVTVTLRMLLNAPDDTLAEAVTRLSGAERDVLGQALGDKPGEARERLYLVPWPRKSHPREAIIVRAEGPVTALAAARAWYAQLKGRPGYPDTEPLWGEIGLMTTAGGAVWWTGS